MVNMTIEDRCALIIGRQILQIEKMALDYESLKSEKEIGDVELARLKALQSDVLSK